VLLHTGITHGNGAVLTSKAVHDGPMPPGESSLGGTFMVPTRETRRELREFISELDHPLNEVKATQDVAADSAATIGSLYKLKAKAGEAIEFLKEQEAPAMPPQRTAKKVKGKRL
jgi:hypothetical protein